MLKEHWNRTGALEESERGLTMQQIEPSRELENAERKRVDAVV